MLKFEQPSPSSSSRRRNTPPQLVTEETRAALLKREGEDESGVRKSPKEIRHGIDLSTFLRRKYAQRDNQDRA
jgi:hypothetical protein